MSGLLFFGPNKSITNKLMFGPMVSGTAPPSEGDAGSNKLSISIGIGI